MHKLSLAIALAGSLMASSISWAETLSATTQAPLYQLDDKLVLGRVESVYLNDIPELDGISFAGKIDTGADTTSMHADNIHVSSAHPKFSKLKDEELMRALIDYDPIDDISYKEWDKSVFADYKVIVSFTVTHPHTGEEIEISDDLERISVIRSRTSKKPLVRPTINIPLTIAGRTVMTDVNLTNRTQFSAPFLVGKTFLDNNAWVFAGYDYLQEQKQAQLIGKKESVSIDGVKQKISYSLQNNYSSLHATNIKVDEKSQQVSFTIEDKQGNQANLTRPLVRMLNVSGEEKPLVFVPINAKGNKSQHWMVYLTDRSNYSTQLRVGKGTLNKRFMIATNQTSLLDDSPKTFNNKSKALQVSGEERLTLDGIELKAAPSLRVKTPLLKVASFEMYEEKGKDWVTYYLNTTDGDVKQFSKPINKKLRVGDSVRPVVFGVFNLSGKLVELPYAIDVLGEDETEDHFVIGQKMSKSGVLINTRTENLLDAYPLFKAGHIEVATVEGMAFPVKLDTGADVSSMNAQNIKLFEKEGKQMVSFTYENDLGMKKKLTREVVDTMTITAKEGEKANIRPVVEMQVTLGELEKKIRVNLQDRSRFHYSMILGKNFLKYGAVVASDTDFIVTEKPDYEK
ncbi:peptidase [Vibrio sp. RE86]|uniref:putative ATP-dependent zinc protease n=1 Tax=Vibrio sp. RE86 TaxID=2607605 RepID=UPI001493535C|nr:RimK/LysX family protein [Vibrio sp. RE86]NOH80868.1 peptidase [Vibrio sp. RE86]